MASSVKKNYFYNLIYQITALLLPLITMPYVARVFNADIIGINSYTNANAQYFVLIGSLGVSIYATKKIAMVRDNVKDLRQNFWEILTIQVIGCLIAYVVFLLTLCTDKSLGKFYFLQGFFILAAAIDVSWYFLGIENFKNASIRSMIVKIVSVVLIFMFVKTENDLWKYIMINSVTMFIGQFVMWLYIKKDVISFKKLEKKNSIRHLRPILALFIPQIATQVYTVLDKTMIGLLADTTQVGLYDQSQKIIRILLSVVTSLGIVMLPRIANLYSKKKYDEVKETLKVGFTVISFLAIPMAFGIMAVSERFIPLFFSLKYTGVIPLTIASSVMIIIIGFGNVFGTQYMLAIGKNKEYTKSVCVGAIVNLTLNVILIPKYYAMGAVIATVTAELSIAIIQFWYSRKIVDFSWIKSTYKYWIAGIIMFIVVRLLNDSLDRNSIILLRQIFFGGITYISVILLLRDKFIIGSIMKFYDKIKRKA